MKTVVYIDDEHMICRAMQTILEGCGATVLTFTDPAEAVLHINAHPPALVICDFRMPGMDGLEVLARLKHDVPFALISGYLALDEAYDERVIEVLSKPVKSEYLLAFVARFIETE